MIERPPVMLSANLFRDTIVNTEAMSPVGSGISGARESRRRTKRPRVNHDRSAAMDTDEQEHKEVFAYFGAAAARLQTLDTILTNILMVNGHIRGPEVTAEELENLEESLQRKTLGQLIAEIRSQVPLPEQLIEVFKSALAKRNFLIHRFMRERAYEFVTPEGRQRMLAELREMQAVAIVANRMADEFLMGMAKVLGITSERLEAGAEALREEARAKEADAPG